MKNLLLISLLIGFAACTSKTPQSVIDRSLNYHDPNNEWPGLNATFNFTETRPSQSDRFTTVVFDNANSYMKINRNDENAYEIQLDECIVLVGDHEPARGLRMRNYYLYLWGLPMKLTDKGTPIDQELQSGEVDGKACDVVRVPYEEDVWYFYFDQTNGRLLQYKFYKDESAGKGELITLEDEFDVGTIKIPQRRSWYTLPEMELIGTDILTSIN